MSARQSSAQWFEQGNGSESEDTITARRLRQRARPAAL